MGVSVPLSFALALVALPAAASAERLACQMAPECADTVCISEPVSVTFAIDRTQFAPAQHAGDPPRRQVTQVTMGEARFPAEPVLMAGGTVRGFWGDGLGGSEILMIVQPDMSAVLTNAREGLRLTGLCEAS